MQLSSGLDVLQTVSVGRSARMAKGPLNTADEARFFCELALGVTDFKGRG